jgi:hypothetical protein
MAWSRRELITIVCGTVALFLAACLHAAGSGKKYQTYRRPEIEIPIRLAVGTIRTPEFPVQHEAYLIMIQAEKKLPFDDMNCMMGLDLWTPRGCAKESLIEAEWMVRDSDHIVAEGSVHEKTGADYANHYIWKHMGHFAGEAGKKYVLEMRFTKDGTALQVTDPHLIVMMTKASD